MTYPHRMKQADYDALLERLKAMPDKELVDFTALKIDSAAFFKTFSVFDDEAHACWEECGRRETPGLYDRGYKIACAWNGVSP